MSIRAYQIPPVMALEDTIEYETGYEAGFKAGYKKAKEEPAHTSKWIRPELGSGYFDDNGCPEFYTCSECNNTADMEYDFCPNCGKKMD